MRAVIWLYIALNGLSLLANIFGRFTLAKVMGITAISSLAQGVLILVGIETLMDAFFLQVEKDRKVNGFTAYFNAILVKDRLRNVMLVGGAILWAVKLLFNLNLFDYVYDFLEEFLTATRKLGDMEFTFSSVAVFLVIIWVSTFISRFIGYLIEGGRDVDPRKKGGRIGSGMLLIRIGVLTVGILLAFTASGIALDKLAIIVGALGVGIGFGLQTIVNNLVSGIILAFEKPIQIGDIIEVGARQGVVKEIGIRASKISTFDGSDVIVPNGDLLSQQLINWTHDNKQNRRVEVIVGVAYGSDLENARRVILEAMAGKEGIQSFPEPQVYVHLLNSSSVDLRVLFWAADINSWVDLKSRVLTDIHAALGREGIQIPFSQTDLHIRSVDPDAAASLRGDK
jgi:small-conductance mechanosensitive channel